MHDQFVVDIHGMSQINIMIICLVPSFLDGFSYIYFRNKRKRVLCSEKCISDVMIWMSSQNIILFLKKHFKFFPERCSQKRYQAAYFWCLKEKRKYAAV